MPPSQPRDSLALRVNRRFFYGWVMLGVAALGMFASGPGQSHIFSVFILPIGHDLGISHTSVSSAYALATLVAAFGLPWVGRLVDRYGVRPILLSVAVLLGFAAMAFGAVTGMVTLALGFAALRFLGQGSLMLCSANLVAQWFNRKRGFALSLMGLGFSLTMAAHPPLAQWLIDQLGWRAAWFWLGILTWLLLVPVVAILVESKPENLGLQPDGDADDHGDRAAGVQGADVGLTIGEAVRTPAFWIIALSLATFSMLVTGLFFHQVSIFQSAGLGPQMAAWVFPISALTMVLAMPVFGRLLDRVPTKPMFACAMLTMTAAMLALVLVDDAATAALYGIAFGINNAAVHTHMTYVWPRFFGRRHLGSIQGTSQTIAVVGASVGPLPLGVAFDLYGAYTGALLMLAGLPVLCSIAILLMRPPQLESGA
ncbi:MAG TPA: MFS transporter [Geminicoccaceae bacterium]|nr:MFS transporter [Geminicoccaceae bacterium]